MTNPLPIPDELGTTVPPDAHATIAAVVPPMQRRLSQLEAKVADLQARLRLHSTNPSKPPSRDPSGLNRKPPTPPTGRQRGGQPGHRTAQRALVPLEQVRSTFHCPPRAGRRGGRPLAGDDPDPLIHQVAELPVIAPSGDAYRLHRLACPGCGETTGGGGPTGVPTGCFGPRWQAVLARPAGVSRLTKRPLQQMTADLFGRSIATGMISHWEQQSAPTRAAPVAALAQAVHQAPGVSIDETSWRADRKKAWLWGTVMAWVTVSTLIRRRARAVAKARRGSEEDQGVVSDRFSVSDWIAWCWRQVCGAHLRRDFPALIDRGRAGETIGRRLLGRSHRRFRYGHRVREGTLSGSAFQERIARLRREVCPARHEGSPCACAMTAATCFELLPVEEGLWTCARIAGVEPRNNTAARAARQAVIWRRISGRTAGGRGRRLVERMRSVVAPCRQQGRHVLDDLCSCLEAWLAGQPIPSLLPERTAEISAA